MGDLLWTISDAGQGRVSYRHRDLAIVGGQTFHLCLPPPLMCNQGMVKADLRFVTSERELDLGSHPLPFPSARERAFSLAVCDSSAATQAPESPLIQSLRFEARLPESEQSGTRHAPVRTGLGRLRPASMPVSSLQLCPYNIVLVTSRGFAELRRRQLLALREWCRAGGSICVVVPRRISTQHQREFLREAFAGHGSALGVDSRGGVTFAPEAPLGGICSTYWGHGRLVAMSSELANDGTIRSSEWQIAADFLWKFRHSQLQSLRRYGGWRGDPLELLEAQPQLKHTYRYLGPLLMPTDVRPLPAWMIAAILGTFILCVGPLDYFLLGLIRLRKLTWVVFPLTAVLLTLATVWLSQHYLGSDARRSKLSVVDVDSSGEPLCETRYELLFAADTRPAVTPLRQELFVPLSTKTVLMNWRGARGEPGRELEYDGRFPGRVQVTQWLSQWSPQLNRRFRLAPDAGEFRFP
ncbi:MAG: hypothetical protein GY842_15155, partial [bacterium]|nr:hypothetical protein [bacterium]